MSVPLRLETLLERAGQLFSAVPLLSRRPDGSLLRSCYGELRRRAWALAALLCSSGLRPGDRVATLLWNHQPHLEAYFGVPAGGGVLHPLNLRLPEADLAAILADADDRFLIVEDSLLPLAAELAHAHRFERVWVVSWHAASGADVGTDGGVDVGPDEGWSDYDAALAAHLEQGLALAQRRGWTQGREREDEAAAMAYTSGTTGQPRGVVYSHRALVLHALATALPDALGLSRGDRVLPLVAMFHANGWGIPYTATMVGAAQIFPGTRPMPATVLELIESERVTFSAGVAAFWSDVAGLLEQRGRGLTGFRLNLGGAPASEALFRRFDALGVSVHMGWGMTEMTPVGAINPRRDPPADEQRTRQGVPLPLIEVQARNEAGELVGWDARSSGQLEVRGPWVSGHYFRQQAASGEWLETDDIVNIDEEGFLRIVDRQSDLIRSGGEWISSVALENELETHPAVREAAVIAMPDEKWQERPLALLVLHAGAHATSDELEAHLLRRFAGWQVPDAYRFVEALPRTATGKLDKKRLRAEYAATEAKEPSQRTS